MTKGKNATQPGHVNLRMLAEHLELSQTTVSLVRNISPSAKSIPQETRNRVLAASYRTVLPDEARFVEEIDRTRRMLELRS